MERRGPSSVQEAEGRGHEVRVSAPRLLERQRCRPLRWRWRVRREFGGAVCMSDFRFEACGLRCLGNTGTSVGDVRG